MPSGNPPMYHLRNSLDLVRSHPCQTVKDSMELVKKIGFRYLWVDEYCIGSSPSQRELHISQMDRIYEGAVLTICALSGENKHLGLPGISLPLQIAPQPYVDLDSERIVATRLTGFLQDTRCSPWNQRAWTMQEASLIPCRGDFFALLIYLSFGSVKRRYSMMLLILLIVVPVPLLRFLLQQPLTNSLSVWTNLMVISICGPFNPP
jgi:hypothetical protein